jgi:hypothetical protein
MLEERADEYGRSSAESRGRRQVAESRTIQAAPVDRRVAGAAVMFAERVGEYGSCSAEAPDRIAGG